MTIQFNESLQEAPRKDEPIVIALNLVGMINILIGLVLIFLGTLNELILPVVAGGVASGTIAIFAFGFASVIKLLIDIRDGNRR